MFTLIANLHIIVTDRNLTIMATRRPMIATEWRPQTMTISAATTMAPRNCLPCGHQSWFVAVTAVAVIV